MPTSNDLDFKDINMVTIIYPDGKTEQKPAPKKDVLKFLQKIVGGYIEIVRTTSKLPENMIMIVNEEGRLNNLDVNVKASEYAGNKIVGTVAIVHNKLLK